MVEISADRAGEHRGPHVFTVEVEEYFQAPAFESVVSQGEWGAFPSRLETPLSELLDALERHGATATFFVVGWVAERHPRLIRELHERGHEVASHGWAHRPAKQLSVSEFREEAGRSKRVIEDVTGAEVNGFRAAGWSLSAEDGWALEILLEEGYRYDSSIRRDCREERSRTGDSPASEAAFPRIVTPSGRIEEIAPLRPDPWRLRCPAGGSYFRLLPVGLTHRQLEGQNGCGTSGVFYLRAWELDDHHPDLPAPLGRRLLHYAGLTGVRVKLERLLSRSSFASVRALRRPSVAPPGSEPRLRRRAL